MRIECSRNYCFEALHFQKPVWTTISYANLNRLFFWCSIIVQQLKPHRHVFWQELTSNCKFKLQIQILKSIVNKKHGYCLVNLYKIKRRHILVLNAFENNKQQQKEHLDHIDNISRLEPTIVCTV